MRYLKEPYYRKDIIGPLKRFDDRNTGFSRGVHEENKYQSIFEKSVQNVEKAIPGRTILHHAINASSKTVDSVLRKTVLGREEGLVRNRTFRLKNPDPPSVTRIIKETARWFGADRVGVAELNPAWIYSHWGDHNVMYTNAARPGDPIEIPSAYKWVIVMIHEMEYELIRRSPQPEASTAMGYSRMAWSASLLASFIRELGYHAIPCGNELGLSVPMAIDAGLGESGRMGILITREFGPRVRISKVFTDLPLATDSPVDIGVQKFCEACKRCAKHCPGQAISDGPKAEKPLDQSNLGGIRKWQVNAMNCLNWWVKNATGCSVCIRVCPWNKPDTFLHRGVRVLAEKGIGVRLLTSMDEWVGYGRQVKGPDYSEWQDPTVERLGSEASNR